MISYIDAPFVNYEVDGDGNFMNAGNLVVTEDYAEYFLLDGSAYGRIPLELAHAMRYTLDYLEEVTKQLEEAEEVAHNQSVSEDNEGSQSDGYYEFIQAMATDSKVGIQGLSILKEKGII